MTRIRASAPVFFSILVLGISLLGIRGMLPAQDFAAIFDTDSLLTAVGNGQINLIGLTLWLFGVGAGFNFLLTHLQRRVGIAMVIIAAALIMGVLVIGVLNDTLNGLAVPLVMNPGTGFVIGCAAGWFVASRLAEDQPAA